MSIATSGAWNCEKVKGGEWSCVTQDGLANTKSTTEPRVTSDKAIALPAPANIKVTPVYVQPPRTVAKRPGWTCTSGEEDETWNCSLIGADPKGRTHMVQGDEYSSGFFASAFDFKQEDTFSILNAQLKYDPWQSCLSPTKHVQQVSSGADVRNTAPMDVTADYSEVFDKEITSFFGNVKIKRADQRISADMASYDTVSETMDAQGHVYYSEDDLALYSDTTLLNLATDEARLRKALFIFPAAPLRGSADVVYRDSKTLSRYNNVAFTSCRPGNQDWVMHASRLKMNKQSGKASAKNVWVEFKGVPFLYTPYISFPIDDRRLSGFLTPTFGSTDDSGFDVSIPYYWNIAPNYDLTIQPRYMTKRGGMLGTEFRYLTGISEGSLGLEYLPYDLLREKPRFSGTFKNRTEFTSNLIADVDLNYVSDDEYFDELKSALGLTYNRHLRSRADLDYHTDGIDFIARLETYQTIDRNIKTIDQPYQKLPQVALNLDHSFEEWPIDVAMENEYVHFYRSGRVSGHRFNTKPSIAFPIETAGAFIKPKFSLQHTQYELQDQVAGKSDSISRTLPIFSVDGGLVFQKDLKLFNSDYQHTIEPRLFYLYIPEDNQDDIPLFDSSLNDFNYSSLFRENRFSSIDRIQDANQITAAVTTRLIDPKTGRERLNLSLGEIFYFRDREVTLSGVPETSSWSNVVAEMSGQLTNNLSFSTGIQWSPELNDIARGQAEIRYRNQQEQIVNLGYRYRLDELTSKTAIHQADASFRLPIYDNWYGVGRMQYSLKFGSTKESFLGLEKESCCWRFRVLWRRYADSLNDNNDDVELEQGIFIQLELKGLTSFGDNLDEFLEENLKGYQRTE